MRITIERIRTVVLAAGVLLIAALAVFLTMGRWRSPFNRRDLPRKLGVDIQQEANGFTHAEFHAGHALFKITASKVEQLKNARYRLHAVKIEMYGPNGGGTDRIEGSEFEYDQEAGIARAAGPVEITLDRPAHAQPAPTEHDKPREPSQIHVRTVGLVFNQNNGIAQSSNHVEFDLPQASGSAMGASYDSQQGKLVLDREVELDTRRGQDPVTLHAEHAEFDRATDICDLKTATARYKNGDAHANHAAIQFREDGSAQQLDASNGLVLTTAAGSRLAAPTGTLQFDLHSQPTKGRLEGGVAIDSSSGDRTVHGTAPAADIEFASGGLLSRAHFERNVSFTSDEQGERDGVPVRAHRSWTSPVADLAFRSAGKGQVELDTLHGIGGVVITSQSQRGNGAPVRTRMAADDLRGKFGAASTLETITGAGHAKMEQVAENGALQTTSGDRIEAHFRPASSKSSAAGGEPGTTQIDSAIMTGNVILLEQPTAKPGTPAPAPLRATAQRAVYEDAGEWLHLTGKPHVVNGGLELDAEKLDIARVSGDAFAHGKVKATWFSDDPAAHNSTSHRAGPNAEQQGPAHIIAAEAQLHQATGEATFRGQARLWQAANSIAAPLIILDRSRQTLVARTTSAADPVRVVMVSAADAQPGKPGRIAAPSVVRVRGGDLKYSDAERKATMLGGPLGSVVAETADATTRSNSVELILLRPGNHAGPNGTAAQVDRMTARGHVVIDSGGRHGTGERLDYLSQRGDYVLTGTPAAPPQITDPVRGKVTGESLIFNSRDDSVNVEGGGRETTTETTAPKRR